MRIQNINKSNQNFTAMSERNNYYEATNAGKFIGSGLAVGCIAERILSKGGFKEFKDEYHKEYAASISEEATKATGTKISITNLVSKMSKNHANSNLIWSVTLLAGCCIGAGAILDGIINAQRSSRADGHYL